MPRSNPHPSSGSFRMLLAILSLPFIFSACRKVDAHDDMIQGYPFLATSIYPTNLLVGDTCTFVGKLFLDQPGTTIQIGQAKAVVVSKSKVWATYSNSRTGLPDSFDVARFIITPDMGVGSNIPVTIAANGYTIQGPPINIRRLIGGIGRTDTTLVVDKLASWLPDNAAAFAGPFVNNSSVASDGTIYFDNPRGIYRVKDQSVSPIIRTGDNLKDQNNATFVLDVIISSVISPDGGTLTFSATVKENIPRADTLYITRLCQMNMATQAVTTLNRSLIANNPDGPSYNEDPSPYNGNAGQLKLTASRLQTDINGKIWFLNIYFPSNTAGSQIQGPFIASSGFYSYITQGIAPNVGCLFNVCQLSNDGNVQSIGHYIQNYDPTASPYATLGALYDDDIMAPDFLISKDASILFGFKFNPVFGSSGVYQMDVPGEEIVNTILPNAGPWTNPTLFGFSSYDTSVRTGLSDHTIYFNSTMGSVFNRFLILPDNELLFCDAHSIFSYDLQHLSAYCYAGTEIQDATLQTQETGVAKWVDFGGIGPSQNDALIFCGTDRVGSVYYCKGGSNESDHYVTATNDALDGVKFYKLHRKGN